MLLWCMMYLHKNFNASNKKKKKTFVLCNTTSARFPLFFLLNITNFHFFVLLCGDSTVSIHLFLFLFYIFEWLNANLYAQWFKNLFFSLSVRGFRFLLYGKKTVWSNCVVSWNWRLTCPWGAVRESCFYHRIDKIKWDVQGSDEILCLLTFKIKDGIKLSWDEQFWIRLRSFKI
jgi:hypothetical protein